MNNLISAYNAVKLFYQSILVEVDKINFEKDNPKDPIVIGHGYSIDHEGEGGTLFSASLFDELNGETEPIIIAAYCYNITTMQRFAEVLNYTVEDGRIYFLTDLPIYAGDNIIIYTYYNP